MPATTKFEKSVELELKELVKLGNRRAAMVLRDFETYLVALRDTVGLGVSEAADYCMDMVYVKTETVMVNVKSCQFPECGYQTNIKGDMIIHLATKHGRK